MAQVQKESTRRLILEVALKLFAVQGYKNTSMADIAKTAGISVGNIYRYFKGKKQVLDEVLPKEFVDNIKNVILKKILTGKTDSIYKQFNDSEFIEQSYEFQKYLVENKYRILILWNGEGTPYENFLENLVDSITDFVLEQFEMNKVRKEEKKSVLKIIYQSYLQMGASVLSSGCTDDRMIEKLSIINRYHILGLASMELNQ